MEFRVLGSLMALADDEPVAIQSSRQRVVLAILLLEANQVVTWDQLVDALWDDTPPATARNQVQICVCELRRKLALGKFSGIVTRSVGYAIMIGDHKLDLTEFERLVAAGRVAVAEGWPQEAVRLLREGLALWHGPALAGVKGVLVQVVAARLNEVRLAAWQDCIDLELELGHHHEVIGELTELVARHPLREGLRAQLMLALYRDGRQAEALAGFRTARDTLITELGLDPGEQLRDIERAILRHHPELRPSRPPGPDQPYRGSGPVIPRQLPAAISDFVARRDVLTAICDLLAPSPAEPDGRPRHMEVVVLSGRSGVGKTTLALFAAQELCDHYPDGQLFAQLDVGGAEPIGSAQVLADFLQALGVPPVTRADGVESLARTYRSRLAGRRILVVLDAAASLSQVVPLLPGSPTCAVIITSRYRLNGLSGARHFEITEFDEPAGVEMLGRVIGDDRVSREVAEASTLVRLCGGLPVALRVVAAKLFARPHWSITRMVGRLKDELLRLDELVPDDLGHNDIGIRTSISLSYESLDPDGKCLLRRLAVLGGTDFAYWVGAPLIDMDMASVVDLMEQLVQVRLVDAKTLADNSVRLQLHELIRVYALERLMAEEPAEQRTAVLHRTLSCWLFLACEAHRRVYGGDFTVLHGAAGHYRLSAEVVDELLADPLGWFRRERAALLRAIATAAQAGLDELCWDLAMTSSTHFESGSFHDDWRQAGEIGLDTVRRVGNKRGEAAMLCSLGGLALAENRLADATSCLESASRLFAEVMDVHGWALAAKGLAYVHRVQGRYAQALSLYDKALPLLHSADDKAAEAHVLSNLAQLQLDRSEYEQARALLVQALDICRPLGQFRVAAQVQQRLGDFYLRTGELTAAQGAFESVLHTVRERSDLAGQAYARYGLGLVSLKRERFDEAAADLVAAIELSARAGDLLIKGRALLALAEADQARGLTVAAAEQLELALAAFRVTGSGPWQARALMAFGHILVARGEREGAAQVWRQALDLAGDDCELRSVLVSMLAQQAS